ncbi:MAG TPA: site-2 protease family protein [Bacillota bacterium]
MLESLLLQVPGLLAAIVFHEYAHARTADALGDPTPRSLGRLTLNPLAHLDPIGILMLWVFHFGWAKPVPVNPYHFRDPRRGMLLVAAAGPLANVVLAYVALALLSAGLGVGGWGELLIWTYRYNLWLAVFNIIPVPPLDGSKILAGLLPPGRGAWLYQLEAYGWLLLVLLLMTGVIGTIMRPLVRALDAGLRGLIGVLGGGA